MPRTVTHVRDRALLERGRITDKTHKIRRDLLQRLQDWLAQEIPGVPLEDLARCHIDTLSEWLEEYMVYMFVNKQSRRAAAETINAVTQQFGWLRSSLAGPWSLLRTWEGLEPVQHHPPIPVQALRALVCTALAWNWPRLAVLLALGFFGLLRPSEAIGLRRQDVSLPSDHVSGDFLFLRVGSPKTRHRGARHQHVRVDEPGLAWWVDTARCPCGAGSGMVLGRPSNDALTCCSLRSWALVSSCLRLCGLVGQPTCLDCGMKTWFAYDGEAGGVRTTCLRSMFRNWELQRFSSVFHGKSGKGFGSLGLFFPAFCLRVDSRRGWPTAFPPSRPKRSGWVRSNFLKKVGLAVPN